MPGDFNCAADFLDMVAACGFPGGVSVLAVNADSGNTTATATSVPAIGRTTDGTPAGVGDNGEIFPRGKRWLLLAGAVSFPVLQRYQIQSGNAVYEIESLSLIGQDAVYRCESHYFSG